MDTAEAAIERAADAGVMDRGAFAKERGAQVPGDWKAMKGRPRKLVRAFHRPLRVRAMKAEGVLVAQAKDRFERTLSTQRVDKLKQSVFPLATDHIVDVPGIKRGVRIKRREVAAPDNAHMRAETAYFTRGFHGCDHLRSRHAGDAKKLYLVIVDRAYDRSRGIILQVAVDDSVFFAAFEHGGKRKHGQREPAVARPGRPGMEEDNHWLALLAT
jgi:hypothetical protein